MEVKLRAETGRATGSRASRRLRREGKIPAVVYGRGIDAIPVAVGERDLHAALHTEAGLNAIINLEVDGGDTYTTLAREVKRHPWRGTISHVDFVRVSLTDTVEAEVAVDFQGTPVGVVAEGGIVETISNSVMVEALATNIPTSIPIDISGLGIGGAVRVEDLPELEGVTYLDDRDTLLVTVSLPAAEVAEAEEEEELELVEGEEMAEGEEAPEAEAAAEEEGEGESD
jgi:large subunit ribosomal protein L25